MIAVLRVGKSAASGTAAPDDEQAWFKQLFELSPDPTWIIEGNQFIECNEAAVKTLGYSSRAELLNVHPSKLSPQTQPDGQNSYEKAERIFDLVQANGLHRFEWTHTKADGTDFVAEVTLSTIQPSNRQVIYCIWRDITERKVAEEAQRIAAATFESQQGMFVTNANKVILRVNKAFTEVTGYTLQEAVGQTPALLKSGRQNAAFYAAMWDSISRTGTWQGEIWNRRKNGTVYPEHLSISSVKDDAGTLTHYVGTFSDLTSYKAAEEQIDDLAHTDLLTGLSNRRKLIIRLQQALMAAEEHQHQCALLMLDLDYFKSLNDAIGHAQGDEVLQRVAKRLSAAVRDGDTVARLGGDEFVVLLDHLNRDPQIALRQVQALANKMLEALNTPYQLAGSTISCTASIGITFFGEQYEDTLEPLKRAELALYQAKSGGRNMLRFFDPQMQAVVDARVKLAAALQEAIQNQQFTLYYQAQVSDSDGIVGAEALVRWFDPKRGMVSPAEFIPLAEETGLILPIGAWVLETACQQLAAWADQPAMAHLSIAVNVSARQFRESNFVNQTLATLERTRANPQRLKLELTESVLIADAEDVILKMNALKAIGIGFAIDDFGTGYSSLSYIKRLPLERLKIDQSFVRNILMDANDAAISRAVIAMATSMGLGVIAEGVETEAQRDFLASLGCHTYQGYLFSKPLPVADFEAFATRF
jgi:diguanylate cyclase (GGDEF)-like protein/PAS domain S-box-containing protein